MIADVVLPNHKLLSQYTLQQPFNIYTLYTCILNTQCPHSLIKCKTFLRGLKFYLCHLSLILYTFKAMHLGLGFKFFLSGRYLNVFESSQPGF